MAEPVKKDDALAAAVREAFHRHMENARLASLANRPSALATEAKRAVPNIAAVRQIDLKAEPEQARKPVPEEAREPAPEAVVETPAVPIAEERHPVVEARAAEAPTVPPDPFDLIADLSIKTEEVRLPSVDEAPLPKIDLDAALADFSMDEITPRPEPDRSTAALTPPLPANDRSHLAASEKVRERQVAPTPSRKADVTQSRIVDDGQPDSARHGRAAISPPVPRPRSATRREPANSNQGVHFGTGSRREVQERSSSRWIVIAALGAASLLCIGIGGYVWISASSPPPKTGAVEGRAAPVSVAAPEKTASALPASPALPAPAATPIAAVPAAPSAAVPAPSMTTLAALPATPAPEAVSPSDTAKESIEESPVGAHSVKTTAIKLDAIDLAIQDARERMNFGDVAAARLILERYRQGGDPRVLFALAETFDPAMARAPGLADPKQAQDLYQAAGTAESAGRIARLQLDKPN